MDVIVSALTLGLIGSFHCAGMCGPIAVALPLGKGSTNRKLLGGIAYNLGRTVTYALMGAAFGLLGKGLSLAGFQSTVSIIMGSIMILSIIFPRLFKNLTFFENTTIKLTSKLQAQFGLLFNKGSIKSLFLIGLLNGLLPCGLVYAALAGSIATASVELGILFMVMFGLGTIPMLLGISLLGNMASLSLRKTFNKVLPFVIVIIGAIFILRGLDLKIPYLSPPKKKLEINAHIKNQKNNDTISVKPCCE